jgi:chromosome segregation ATPase
MKMHDLIGRYAGRLVVGLCFAAVMGIPVVNVWAQTDPQADIPTRLVALNQRLQSIQRALDDAEKQAKAGDWQLHDFERETAYTNETTRTLYREMKTLEKQLNEKRKEYTDAVRKLPEFREVEKTRAHAYARLSQLREEEQQLRGDINRLKAMTADPGQPKNHPRVEQDLERLKAVKEGQ